MLPYMVTDRAGGIMLRIWRWEDHHGLSEPAPNAITSVLTGGRQGDIWNIRRRVTMEAGREEVM